MKNNLIYKKFGKLTPILDLGRTGHNRLIKCKCECGKEINVLDTNLIFKRTISCGCLGNSLNKNNINWKGYGDISHSYFSQIKRGASDRNILFNIEIHEIWDLFIKQNRKCALSGIELTFRESHKERHKQTASLDRIDSSKGYTLDNIQWIHKDLNHMKLNYSEKYFINFCQLIIDNLKVKCNYNQFYSFREKFLFLNELNID